MVTSDSSYCFYKRLRSSFRPPCTYRGSLHLGSNSVHPRIRSVHLRCVWVVPAPFLTCQRFRSTRAHPTFLHVNRPGVEPTRSLPSWGHDRVVVLSQGSTSIQSAVMPAALSPRGHARDPRHISFSLFAPLSNLATQDPLVAQSPLCQNAALPSSIHITLPIRERFTTHSPSSFICDASIVPSI